jgi:hypothetical protein
MKKLSENFSTTHLTTIQPDHDHDDDYHLSTRFVKSSFSAAA